MTSSETLLNRRRPAAAVTDQGNVAIRASAVGDCRRALHYAARQVAPTNPPDALALTRMDAGRALESILFQAMRRDGWKTSNYEYRPAPRRPSIRLRLGSRLTITGIPDGRGAHAELTGGDYALIEAKARSHGQYKFWRAMGVAFAHPAALAQTAVYRAGMLESGREEISPDTPAVIAVLDTETKEYDTELLAPALLDRTVAAVASRLNEFAQELLAGGEPPEPDFQPSDWQCQRCPWRDLCRPPEDQGAVDDATPEAAYDLNDVVDAVQRYQRAADESRSKAAAEKAKTAARRDLFAAMDYAGVEEFQINPGAGDVLVQRRVDRRPAVTAQTLPLLKTMLAPEQLERVVSWTETQRLIIKALATE